MLPYQKLDDKQGEASCAVSWGHLYKSHGLSEKAITCYRRALALLPNGNDDKNRFSILTSVAECYLDLQDYKAAFDSVKQASYLSEETHNEQKEIIALAIQAKILAELGDYETAIENLKKTYQYFNRNGNRQVEAVTTDLQQR